MPLAAAAFLMVEESTFLSASWRTVSSTSISS